MKKITLFILVVTTFISCKKEIPLTFSEINFMSEDEAIIEVNIPKFEGSSEVANEINSTIENYVTQAILRSKDKSIITISEAAMSFDNEFKSFGKSISEASQPWEAFVDGEVTYQSSDIICVAINAYTNTGGVHGNSIISFLNFNPAIGELYQNEELVNDLKSLQTIAETHFNKMIKEREDFDETHFQFPETIGFNEDGVIILLNSNGLIVDNPEFIIPYEELNGLLKVR